VALLCQWLVLDVGSRITGATARSAMTRWFVNEPTTKQKLGSVSATILQLWLGPKLWSQLLVMSTAIQLKWLRTLGSLVLITVPTNMC
jgi:hypothetical protein